MNWKEKMIWLSEPDDGDSDYCKLALKDFIIGKKIPFTIYIQIHANKYTKLADQGEDLSEERLRNYEQKGVTHLFVKKTDFRECVNYHTHLNDNVQKSSKIPAKKKKKFFSLTSDIVLENLYVNGVNKEDFDGAQEFMLTSLDMMTDDGETFDLLKSLNGHSNYLYAHCLGVSLYAVMIARKMSLDFPKIHFSVSMAGLFHDIGKREINSYILEKKRASLSQAERAIYETHPQRGAEILDSLNVPPEVVQTVLQHHEDCMGTGYPQRLRKNQIIPIARIISVANLFCGYAIKNPQSKGFTAEESIKKMESIFGQRLDSVPFLALKEIFGMHTYEFKEPKIVV